MKPIADKLQLVASATEVQTLEEVSFTASTVDGSPFTIREWTWVPDDGSPPVIHRGRGPEGLTLNRRGEALVDLAGGGAGCTITNPVCTDSVIRSGTMYVRAWVINKIEQAEAHVNVMRDRLVVTPPFASVNPGDTVSWTASTVLGGGFEMKRWEWVSAGNIEGLGPSGPACGTRTTCQGVVYEAGRIEAYAILEGESQEVSATGEVEIIPCPEPFGEPTLDHPAVRGAMKKFHEASNPFDPQTENRREWRWAVLQDPQTGAIRVLDLTVTSSPCTNTGLEATTDFSQYTLIATGHTHPGWPGEMIWCGGLHHDEGFREWIQIVPGASDFDWANGPMQFPRPEWIVRNDKIVRVPVVVIPNGEDLLPENNWAWDPATGCKL